MDAPNPSATPTFASRTPLHIGAVGLKVRDLDRAISFYRNVLGLAVLDRGKDATALGAGGVRFVHLEHRPNAEPDDPRRAATSRAGSCTWRATRCRSRALPTTR